VHRSGRTGGFGREETVDLGSKLQLPHPVTPFLAALASSSFIAALASSSFIAFN
jgi:hypothetical protein